MLRTPIRMLTAIAAVAACADVTVPADTDRVEAVRVIPFAAWLLPGDTVRLTAQALNAERVPIERAFEVEWWSALPAVAGVDAGGLVTGVAPGDAEIIASVEGVDGSSIVHVLPRPADFAPYVNVAAGDDFTCALDDLGIVVCWGLNAYGQLGSGGTGGAVPVAVGDMPGARAVATGTRHACAVAGDGQPWCWGWNSVGQVGPWLSQKIVTAPQAVPLAGRHTSVVAGSGHSCALREDGAAFCWGSGVLGQLGGGSRPSVALLRVEAQFPFTALVAGHAHTCGLDADGLAWCWGWNEFGQLGTEVPACDADIPCALGPVRVRGTTRFRSLSAGLGFTCGLDTGGAAYCWGANAFGQLGTGPGAARTDPGRVPGLPALVDLEAGREHVCGIDGAGTVYCWGANREGQVGDGSRKTPAGPVVAGLAPGPGQRVAAGGAHTCVILSDGQVICWGSNAAGQLGLNPAVPGPSPLTVPAGAR